MRLRALHGEAGRNLELGQFVARVPAACVVLMLTGTLTLIWAAAAGGAGLKGGFAWAALVLLGMLRMARNIRRSVSRSLRRTPLWNGNVEPPLWTILTDRDHIIRWAWRTRHQYDDVIELLARERPGLPVVRLRSQAETETWLASLTG